MKLSEIIVEAKNRTGKEWKHLEADLGFGDGKLRKIAKGNVPAYLRPETVQRIAEFTGHAPVIIVLALAEEQGIYNPETEGVLSTGGVPTQVRQAVEELHEMVVH